MRRRLVVTRSETYRDVELSVDGLSQLTFRGVCDHGVPNGHPILAHSALLRAGRRPHGNEGLTAP